jgi:hypothetical protein
MWAISFKPRPLYRWYSLHRKLSGPQNRPIFFVEDKYPTPARNETLTMPTIIISAETNVIQIIIITITIIKESLTRLGLVTCYSLKPALYVGSPQISSSCLFVTENSDSLMPGLYVGSPQIHSSCLFVTENLDSLMPGLYVGSPQIHSSCLFVTENLEYYSWVSPRVVAG